MPGHQLEAPSTDGVEEATATDDPHGLSKDDAFHLLQNARRRAVLRYLRSYPDVERFRMRDVAEEVAAWEHDTTIQRLSSEERQRVYIALYQSHLPKLDDEGIIAYDRSRGFIEPRPPIRLLDPFLDDGLHVDSSTLSVDDSRSERSPDRVLGAITDVFGG